MYTHITHETEKVILSTLQFNTLLMYSYTVHLRPDCFMKVAKLLNTDHFLQLTMLAISWMINKDAETN
jgi:hypothetical protein